MANERKGDSGKVPTTSADELRRLVADVADHTVIEILEAQPTFDEVALAAMYAREETNAAVTAGHELSGASALIYDALMQDELYRADEA